MWDAGSGWRTAVVALACFTAAAGAARSQGIDCTSSADTRTIQAGPCPALAQKIAAMVAEPAVARAHWGVAVTAMDGSPIYSLNEGQFFQPASNAKLFTTAAAMALLGATATATTRVMAAKLPDRHGVLAGNLVLLGAGDANLSGRTIPYVPPALRPKPPPPEADPLRYLEEMADQVAKTGLKVLQGDVVGDDTLFPWQPYPEDWAIDDMVWGYGAPVSALSVNDNVLELTVAPAAEAGSPAVVTIEQTIPYYMVTASVTTTVAKTLPTVQIERAPGSKVVRVYGTIPAGMSPLADHVAIDDPAEYAAMAFRKMLEDRGIRVTGQARAAHRPSVDVADFTDETRQTSTLAANAKTEELPCTDCRETLAAHVSPSLMEDIVVTNKISQNLHAELLLRRLGKAFGLDGSAAQGIRVVRQFLINSGIDKDDFFFFDGSGLSGHDLVTPRAVVRLLQYASTQPWFADWKKSLPAGGEDGTLAWRFDQPPLKDHLFAKTGTLGEARALSGYLDCASGRTVIFSVMVGNHAPRTHEDEIVMDRIVEAIAAAN